jgi:hypothetical protein
MGGGVIGAIFKEINKITKFVILQDPLQKSVKKKDTGIIAKAFDMMKKHGIGGIKK